jgi:hypothetical protein
LSANTCCLNLRMRSVESSASASATMFSSSIPAHSFQRLNRRAESWARKLRSCFVAASALSTSAGKRTDKVLLEKEHTRILGPSLATLQYAAEKRFMDVLTAWYFSSPRAISFLSDCSCAWVSSAHCWNAWQSERTGMRHHLVAGAKSSFRRAPSTELKVNVVKAVGRVVAVRKRQVRKVQPLTCCQLVGSWCKWKVNCEL